MTLSVALAVALFAQSPSTGTERAPSAPTKLRIEVRAVGDCTSRTDLAERIATRSRRIEVADDAAISARVAVTSPRQGSMIAEVAFATSGAEQPPRRFVARSCAEAADAAALIIAVTLDPTIAATGPGEGTNAAPPPKPPDQPPPPAVVETAPPAPSAPKPTGRQFGAFVAGQTMIGPAPAVLPGIALYLMAALDRDGPWAPAVFVGATRVWRGDLSQPGGTASFTLDAASVDACPLRLRWSLVAARPCASALVGRLSASGTETEQGMGATRPFATAGVVGIASVGTTIELSLRLGLGITLIRDAYEFGSNVFHRASLFTASGSLGVGVRWP